MTRTEVINHLISTKGYKSYLEIGVQFPESNFLKVNAEYKIGVEPFPMVDMKGLGINEVESDNFFDTLAAEQKFDIVFIDGLHTREQCLADILNSLKHLNEGGCILVHDCLPTAEYQTSKEDNNREWTGEVWKSIVDIQSKNGVRACTIDTDWGIGYITQDFYTDLVPFPDYMELTWEQYTTMRNQLLNIKSVDQWKNSL
jgi:hypothetical protein